MNQSTRRALPLVLASGSPRRRELLATLGVEFQVEPANIDETVFQNEKPYDYVGRLSAQKAEAVAQRFPERLVLAADTSVILEGRILGKPAHESDAKAMLKALSGKSHSVLTGVSLRGVFSADRVVASTVRFRMLSSDVIDWYVSTHEPLDKAGAYAVQGLGALLIEGMEGTPSNVIGLPLPETVELLHMASYPVAWK